MLVKSRQRAERFISWLFKLAAGGRQRRRAELARQAPVEVRRPGAPSLCPADAALSLPACRPSHALARLAAAEAVGGSFEAAHAAITRRCGPVMGKRQVEQAVVSAACDIAVFYAARIPVPCTASTLLVLSADAKGIVMRPQALRPKTARATARQGRMRARLIPGEKPCRKRMATLACVTSRTR